MYSKANRLKHKEYVMGLEQRVKELERINHNLQNEIRDLKMVHNGYSTKHLQNNIEGDNVFGEKKFKNSEFLNSKRCSNCLGQGGSDGKNQNCSIGETGKEATRCGDQPLPIKESQSPLPKPQGLKS